MTLLCSHTVNDKQEKTNRVNEIAKSVGLKIHPGKTKVMRAKNKSTHKICIGDTELEEVQHFKYLGSYISTDSNIE